MKYKEKKALYTPDQIWLFVRANLKEENNFLLGRPILLS